MRTVNVYGDCNFPIQDKEYSVRWFKIISQRSWCWSARTLTEQILLECASTAANSSIREEMIEAHQCWVVTFLNTSVKCIHVHHLTQHQHCWLILDSLLIYYLHKEYVSWEYLPHSLAPAIGHKPQRLPQNYCVPIGRVAQLHQLLLSCTCPAFGGCPRA